MMSSRLTGVVAVLLLFVWLPVHAQVQPQAHVQAHVQVLDKPIQSENDKRSYQNIVLANGMKVLLISDPAADKAAAAMDVAVGNGSDPKQRQGLAHFLEHMLFLGTKKYPKAGEYQEFISSHGGSHNAYTGLENTNYFFDVDPQQLDSALDRFSQFFIAPLFNEAYVERERNAVDSEYKAGIRDDGRRSGDVFRELYDPGNPGKSFGVGSLETLADKPNAKVRDDLLAFYQQHYSANIMALVVLGREPLPTLQAMVERYFSAVPNHQLTIDRSPKPEFRPGLLPARVQIQSIRDERNLLLLFPLPATPAFDLVKSDNYVSYLLGHEGEGSLLFELKRRSWAESLMAGVTSTRYAASMAIQIRLTAEGYKHTDEMVAMFFQTVQLLRDQGVVDWQYEEIKALAETGFRFREKDDEIGYVSGLADKLHDYPAAEVLRGSSLMTALDKKQVDDLLSRLRPDNLLLSITAPDIQGEQRSQYYATPYRVTAVTAQEKMAWLTPIANAALSMFKPNVFVSEHLQLKKPHLMVGQTPSAVPVQIVQAENYQLWFLQDTKFSVPKGNIMVYVKNPHATDTVRNYVMTGAFNSLLIDKLNPQLYDASLAGLSMSIVSRARGLGFQFFGYSDKQGLLLKTVMDAFSKPAFTEERFQVLKEHWIDQLRNIDKMSPYKPVSQDISVLLVHGQWTRAECLQALESLTFKELQIFMASFLQSATVEMLVYGNFYQADAEKLGGIVQNAMKSAAKPVKAVSRVVSLPALPQPYLYIDQVKHDDTVVAEYFQAPGDDLVQLVHMFVLEKVLSASFFNALRTEQQLGYIVRASGMILARVPGMSFLVQSPSHDAADIHARINTFLAQYYEEIKRFDDVWFEKQKQAVMLQLKEEPKNQAIQASDYWSDLNLGYTTFDSRQQMMAILQKMTREELLVAYRSLLLGVEKRQLLVVAPGKAGMANWKEAANYHRIENVDAFKTQQSSYVLP